MRDPNRIDKVLDRIREIWKAHPDLRLTQIVAVGSYYLEDDQLLEVIESNFGDEEEDDE